MFQFPNNNYLVTPDADQAGNGNIQVTPILTTPGDCNALVQANAEKFVDGPLAAQCFVYKDAGGPSVDRVSDVRGNLPRPRRPGCTPFEAELGSTYDFNYRQQSGFQSRQSVPGLAERR